MNYLNFSQLRQKLGGRGRTTIYRDIEAGRLPEPVKLGGRLYWFEQDVDDVLKSHSQK
ncbi:helix-turn-helix transcriptional regulator [Shimia sp. MIT910701]|uniref:helix-turn-helix transcriptional regulator n=1 Tax=Shimia sp. MIT910701 TaxID=3096987 RepID=UPI00399B139A